MATATLVKHNDVEMDTSCEGHLISTYLSTTKCGECGQHVSRSRIIEAQERLGHAGTDGLRFYGLVMALVDREDEY